MKGMNRGLFLEVGKGIAQNRNKPRKHAYSLLVSRPELNKIAPSTAPNSKLPRR